MKTILRIRTGYTWLAALAALILGATILLATVIGQETRVEDLFNYDLYNAYLDSYVELQVGTVEEIVADYEWQQIMFIPLLLRVAAHGLGAVPTLINATEHTNGLVRLRALQTLYVVGERHRRLVDLMPLFVRAIHDALPDVRLAGVTAIGGTCAPLRAENMTNELQTAFGELSTATRDSDNDVRLTSALYLLKFGQDRLVPEEVRQQVRDKNLGPDSL